jgi:hypothetical protein
VGLFNTPPHAIRLGGTVINGGWPDQKPGNFTGDPMDSGGGSDSIRKLGVRPDSKTCIQVISQPTGDFLTTTKYCDAIADTLYNLYILTINLIHCISQIINSIYHKQ